MVERRGGASLLLEARQALAIVRLWDPLRDDPRFKEILDEVRLPLDGP